MREPELFPVTEPTAKAANGFSHHFKKWFSIAFPISIGVFLTVYAYNSFTDAQIQEILNYFKNANYYYIYLAAFLALLGNISRAYRWKFPLEQMGYKPSFANNFMAVNIGYLLNLTVPKSGEISRALIVKKYNGIPFDKGFGSIIAERIVDVGFLFAFMLVAVYLQFDIVQSFILDKIPVAKLLWLSLSGIICFIVVLLVYRYSKNRWVLAIKEKISGLQQGVLSILYMKKKWAYLFHTFFLWFSYIVTFYLASFVFPETSALSADAIVTSFVVGSIAIAFTNSGFGSYPFLIAKILVFYSISETTGSAFGWIVWTSQMLLVLVLGLGSFIFLPLLNRKK